MTTDLVIDWILLLWISKVKPNYTMQNSLPATTCDVNLSQTTLFTATMLINICRVLKILQNCTVLALFPPSIPLQICITRALWSPEGKFACKISFTFDIHRSYIQSTMRSVSMTSRACHTHLKNARLCFCPRNILVIYMFYVID